MKRRLKRSIAVEPPSEPAADANAVLQVKVWLVGISPMVWRRVLVPASFTLRELHGVIQVAMGWEGIHLYVFRLRAARYGSWELSASSPDVTLADLRFRKGARLIYEYDLNIPWRHEVRIEDRLERRLGRPIPFAPGATAPVRPRIAAARRASWTTATTGFHSMRLKTWTPWSRSSRKLWKDGRRCSRSTRRRAGGWRMPWNGPGSRTSPGPAVFAAASQRPSARRRAPQPHAPAVVRRSARRCASKSAASNAASSPCRCRTLEISAWAAGSVS